MPSYRFARSDHLPIDFKLADARFLSYWRDCIGRGPTSRWAGDLPVKTAPGRYEQVKRLQDGSGSIITTISLVPDANGTSIKYVRVMEIERDGARSCE